MSRPILTTITVVLAAVVVLAIVAIHGARAPLLAVVVLAGLIAGGNLLYGSNSHYARAQARTRPAQQAHERAIDEARAAQRGDPSTETDPGPPPP